MTQGNEIGLISIWFVLSSAAVGGGLALLLPSLHRLGKWWKRTKKEETNEEGGNDMTQPRLEDGRGNFRDKDGKAYVVRCPRCKRENYAPAVASGQCAWCGWDASKEETT